MAETWDVVVIGAGAAGLMAAIHAAERGRRTLVLEKNRKAGVKILMSGGTRCNITQATDNRGIVAAYGPPGKFLHSALAAFSVQQTLDFLQRKALPPRSRKRSKIFPVSDKASDVLDALLRRLARSGAVLAVNEPVTAFSRLSPSGRGAGGEGGGFAIDTALRALSGDHVVLTTGGQSYPGAGTTGDGYRFAGQLGHRIVPPRPALVPLTTNVPWVADLRGITLPDVAVRIAEQETTLAQRRGSLLFAHFGLSGPVILDVSRAVSGHAKPDTLVLAIDLLPAQTDQALGEWLRTESLAQGKKQLAGLLSQQVPRRLCGDRCSIKRTWRRRSQGGGVGERRTPAPGPPRDQRAGIPITGTLGFKKAEVTWPAASRLDEVDSRTMQSKLIPQSLPGRRGTRTRRPHRRLQLPGCLEHNWLAGASV